MPGIPNIDIDPPKYGPPNMAAQLFGMISSLPDAYQQGVKQKFERGQMARTEEQQKPYTGRLDPMEIMHESMRRGGIEDAQKYVGPLLEMMGNRQINEGLGGGGPSEPSYGPQNPRMSPDAQTPGGLRGETSQSQGPAGEDTRHQNIRQLAINAGIDPQSDAFRQAFAGTNIDREFTSPLQAAGASRRLQMLSQGDAGPGQAGPTAALGPAGGGGQGTVYMPGPGMQGAPQAGQPPGQPGQPPIQMAQAGPSQGAGPETPVGTEAQAKFYEDRGNKRLAVSTAPFAKPKVAEAAQKAAEQDFARAKAIRETSAKYGESLDPRMQASKTQQKIIDKDIDDSAKKYDGLQGLGQAGQLGNQKLDRIRAVMSDPGFMSGAGHEIAQAFKQWSVTLGGDPKAAQPMEEFHKTAQQLLSDDIKAMGASGAGPVRVAEVQIMKQATANLGISPAANRYLVEEAYRVHNDNIAVSRLAQQYKQQHGYLDAGWDAVRDKFYADHPLFTKAELADPRLVSPPYLPKDIAADPAKHEAWVRQQGIKPGDPIKTDDPKRPIVYAR